MDHIYRRTRIRRRAGQARERLGRTAAASQWHLHPPLPQRKGEDHQRLHPRLWLSGRAYPEFRFDAPGIGAAYKNAVRESQWVMTLVAFGECLARKENRVEIDAAKEDAWGIPVLKIAAEHSDNDFKLYADSQDQAAEMLEAAGGKYIAKTGQVEPMGLCIHEVGTARMGNDRKSSVFNRYCQSHELPNLFCTDGAVWTSTACQNPTLTMMALTVRTCDYITREYAGKA